MIIRNATTEDIKSINEILDLYWSDSFRHNLTRKLEDYLQRTPEIGLQNFVFMVAEENNEIVGVGAYRDAPSHMRQFAATNKPAEFYVVAVREKGKGIGGKLRDELIKRLTDLGYTEVVFFSGVTHQESWSFHDQSNFKRVGEMTAPNGEAGYVWRLELNCLNGCIM